MAQFRPANGGRIYVRSEPEPYALSRHNRLALLLVILCIALNWFGDSMDGTLARVRCQPRPRDAVYVDHMVDIFGSVALMGGLGLSGFSITDR